MNRNPASITKVDTPFGGAYIRIVYDGAGKAIGGSITHKGKAPESTIAQLFDDLSAGLQEALRP